MKIDISSLQRAAGPVAAASSVTAATAAVLLALWNVGECVRFQTQRDECDVTIEQSLPTLVAGFAAVSGTLGGFWTYNGKLRRARDEKGRFLPADD